MRADAAPFAQVAHFAACMLLTKVRREWSTLAPEERSALSGAVSAALAPAASRPLVARRLCLVLGAAGARSAPPEAAHFVRQALSLAAASLPLALALLQALAEEADEAPRARRAALLTPLAPALAEVLPLCERALREGGGATRADALHCALVWLRLQPDAASGGVAAGGRLLLSPPAFASAAPALHATALACLASDDDADAAAAVDLLAELHAVCNPREDAAAEAASVNETISALLALRERAASSDGEPTARCASRMREPHASLAKLTAPFCACSAIARVATALAERHLPQLCAGEAQWLHLVQLMCDTVAARCVLAWHRIVSRRAYLPHAGRSGAAWRRARTFS
jgi:hypothetical protein